MTAPAPSIFAIEPTALQLVWGDLRQGSHRVEVGAGAITIEGGGPRACTVAGLAPGTPYAVAVNGEEVAAATTLEPPPGRPLARVATLSDLHIGETVWGHLPCLRDVRPDAPLPPVRCLTAALEEITAWQPDLLVVKGDISHDCRREEFEEVGRLLKAVPFPLLVMAGNHDGGNHRGSDPVTVLAEFGIDLVTRLTKYDLPGLRVIALPTLRPGLGTAGRIGDAGRRLVRRAIADAPAGVLVCTHHQPRRWPVLTYWPPGIGWLEGQRLLASIERAHPASMLSAGHTHRNRRWQRGTVVVTEVGSVKDYPGTWGAYVAYEGGIVQSVRRVEASPAIEWTERGARMLVGIWGRYAPGRLEDRCFAHTWPT